MRKRVEIPEWYRNNRLAELRRENGYTQSHVADHINCVLKTYQNYEQGRNFPTLQYADSLANLYSVSIDYLLGKSSYTNADNEMISEVTGLTDSSIDCLKTIKFDSDKLKLLNLLMSNYDLFSELLQNLGVMFSQEKMMEFNNLDPSFASIYAYTKIKNILSQYREVIDNENV